MYAERLQLKQLIEQLQTTGRMPDELVTILDKIITGIAQRYKYSDLDDKKQEFFIKVINKVNNIKLEGNIFNYLTTVARNTLRQKERKRPLLLEDLGREAD
jgi:DNA-directed RNA polymerase specialized sigma24 family protein